MNLFVLACCYLCQLKTIQSVSNSFDYVNLTSEGFVRALSLECPGFQGIVRPHPETMSSVMPIHYCKIQINPLYKDLLN